MTNARVIVLILLWQVWFALRADLFGLRSNYHQGVPVVARLWAQAAQCANFGFRALCSPPRQKGCPVSMKLVDRNFFRLSPFREGAVDLQELLAAVAAAERVVVDAG